jgi:alanine racemase
MTFASRVFPNPPFGPLEGKAVPGVLWPHMRATRAIIHLNHLRHNIRALRAHLGEKAAVCMAVKADAYGHGAVRVSRAALEEGVSFLGVAVVEEGAELRAAGITEPILMLGLPFPDEAGEIVRHRLTPFVADKEIIKALAAAAGKAATILPVHLKVDTGMGRIGCAPEDAPGLAELIHESKSLLLEGIATHFPVSDAADDRGFTLEQVDRLRRALDTVRTAGRNVPFIHAANSGAIIDKPHSYFNLVRPGIILYGYYPSAEQERIIPVKPVMDLVSKIVFIKRVPAGTGISYGLTHVTDHETRIATVPIGYGDGYSRLLSNRATVFVNGRRCPVVGRVCMDQTMIDLGPEGPDRPGDDVVLFGADAGAPDAAEIARQMGTIPYEVTCLVTKRVPRLYVDKR